MTRDEFFSALEAKVDRATQDWPAWKYEVLQNSFRSSNSAPRQAVVIKNESSTDSVTSADKKD